MLAAVPGLMTVLAATTAPTFAIVDVDASDALMGLGAQVTAKIVDGAAALHANVTSPEQLRAMLQPEKYQALKKCRDSPSCVASAVAGTPVKRVIIGSLARDDRNYLLQLWHHDVTTSSVVCDVDRSILIAARRFAKDVEQAIPPLLRGEREARGTLVIEVNVPNAHVLVNGDTVGPPPLRLTVKPGKHELKVTKNKYLPVTRLATVEADQTTTESVRLLLIPGEIADEELAKLTKASTTAHSFPVTAPTWVFGGLAVGAGIASTVFGLLARSQETALVGGFDSATGVYTGTRAQALEQNRNATLANASFIALGVTATATLVFLILDLMRSPDEGTSPRSTP